MLRWCAAIAAASLVASITFALAREATADDRLPELLTVQDLPDDVRAELDVTWQRFVERFAARTRCIDDVAVELVRRVDGGDARYVVADARIEIKIPTTPARFRESFAHELAHHLEHTCDQFVGLREQLRPLLGAPGQPWAGGTSWEEDPSERWAEAVVELVNGERIRHVDEVPVDPRVVEAIAHWGVEE